MESPSTPDRRRARAHAAALGAVALVLTLAACQTGADPGDDGTPSATTTSSPSPTASAEPTPSATPSVGEPVVNGPNSITSPLPGEVVAGPDVTATGEGTAFEATLNYRVLAAGTEDEVVPVGFTEAGANGEIGPWTIDLMLEPGEYTLQVWEPDMSDGESPDGPYRNLVEVTFTVS